MSRLSSLAVLILATAASAHARWLSPTPRNTSDSLKDPNGPCGNVPRTAMNTEWVTGSTVKLDWEETVNHDGCFLISISPANDLNFALRKTVAHSNDGGTPRPYSTNLTLPAGLQCDNCTIQLQQIMLASYDGGVCPPPNLPSGTHYFSCADIRISLDGGPVDAGTGGGAGGGSGGGSAGGAGGGATGGGGGAAGGGAGGGTGGGAAAGGGTATGGSGGAAGGGTGGGSGGVVTGQDPGAGCSAMPIGSLGAVLLLALGLRRRPR